MNSGFERIIICDGSSVWAIWVDTLIRPHRPDHRCPLCPSPASKAATCRPRRSTPCRSLNTSDPGVTDTARAIYTAGAAAGRSGDIFLKVGDSNTDFGGYAPNQYLNPLATSALYGLSNYGGTLTDTVATYRAGGGVDSFLTNNGTAYPGFTVPLVLSRLPAALASSRAGVALVMLGTNDLAVYHNPEQFRAELTSVVSQLTAAGVVPVLSTVPEHLDNAGYAPLVRQYDQVIADVADAARVPLWNLWRSLGSLPHAGLDGGGVHLNASPNGGGSFFPADMLYGQNVRNVQAVQALDWFRLAVAHGPPATPATPAPAAEWTPVPVREPVYAVGRDAGQGPVVEVYDAATNKLVNRFLAYESSFTGGVRVATADIDGDGYTDVVTVPGVGGGPVVRVVSGKDGSDLGKLFAFEPAFRSGYTVTAGDLDGDGAAEVVVGAGAGGGRGWPCSTARRSPARPTSLLSIRPSAAASAWPSATSKATGRASPSGPGPAAGRSSSCSTRPAASGSPSWPSKPATAAASTWRPATWTATASASWPSAPCRGRPGCGWWLPTWAPS